MDREVPPPAGYYYQPPGSPCAQFIGPRIPPNFQLPPMAPYYPDPNVPNPMPGFYHIDSFGNPPEYLGINPPRSREYRRETSTTASKSSGYNTSEYCCDKSINEMDREEPVPTGYYYQPPGGGYAQYIGHRVPSNFQLPSMPAEYIDPNVSNPMPGFYYIDSSSNQPIYLGINPPKPAGNQSQRPSAAASHAPRGSERSEVSTYPGNQYGAIGPPSDSYVEYTSIRYTTPDQQSIYSASSQQGSSNQRPNRAQYNIKTTNDTSPSMELIPPFNTRPQGYQNTTFTTESRDMYQWPKPGYYVQQIPSESSRSGNTMNPYGIQRNSTRENYPSTQASLSSSGRYNERRQDRQQGYLDQDSIQGSLQGRIYDSGGSVPTNHYSENRNQASIQGSIPSHISGGSAPIPDTTTISAFSTNVPQRDMAQNFSQNPRPSNKGHSHGGMRYGQ